MSERIASESPFSVGVCTWIFGDLPLAQIATHLARLGFDGVELSGNLSLYTAAEAKNILEDAGLSVFSLTPENVDLAHPDVKVRESAVDYYDRLLDFAAEIGHPLVSCHGLVGRVAPLASMALESEWLIESVRAIAVAASDRGLSVVFEVLNRYETHTIRTGRAALDLLDRVNVPNLGILLDAYHMNIEEPDPPEAIRAVGRRLWLYHAADSNREGLGNGHTNFDAQIQALRDIQYRGPIILECTAPGPDPFTAIKDERSLAWLEKYLVRSLDWLDDHWRSG